MTRTQSRKLTLPSVVIPKLGGSLLFGDFDRSEPEPLDCGEHVVGGFCPLKGLQVQVELEFPRFRGQLRAIRF